MYRSDGAPRDRDRRVQFMIRVQAGVNAVRQKYSRGARVVFEQTAETISAVERFSMLAVALIIARKQQNVPLALMIPLRMKVLHKLPQCTSQRAFTEQDQLRQAFLLYRAYPSLCER